MNSTEKVSAPLNTNVPHPDMSLVRKNRVEKLEWLLDKATKEDNIGLIRKFTKELQIQKAYLQIES